MCHRASSRDSRNPTQRISVGQRMRILPLIGSLVVIGGCTASRPQHAFSNLCSEIQTQACRKEVVEADGADLATVVLVEVGEQQPQFGHLLSSLTRVPASQRKAEIERVVSSDLGAKWTCAPLDAIWAGQHPTCSE